MARFLPDSQLQSDPICHSLSNFYREEFLRCQRCLDQQREFFSEHTLREVEKVLARVLAQLDRLCAHADADEVVSRLLRQFDAVTPLAAWSDPRHTH